MLSTFAGEFFGPLIADQIRNPRKVKSLLDAAVEIYSVEISTNPDEDIPTHIRLEVKDMIHAIQIVYALHVFGLDSYSAQTPEQQHYVLIPITASLTASPAYQKLTDIGAFLLKQTLNIRRTETGELEVCSIAGLTEKEKTAMRNVVAFALPGQRISVNDQPAFEAPISQEAATRLAEFAASRSHQIRELIAAARLIDPNAEEHGARILDIFT
jgi:hypothetical protein